MGASDWGAKMPSSRLLRVALLVMLCDSSGGRTGSRRGSYLVLHLLRVEGFGDGLVLVAELTSEHAVRDGQRVIAQEDGSFAEPPFHPQPRTAELG